MCAFKQKLLFLEISLFLFQCTPITSCLFAPIKSSEASALILFWNRMKIMLTIVYYSYKNSAQLQKLFYAVSLNISLQTLMHRCVFFELCFCWNLMLCPKQLWCYRRFKKKKTKHLFPPSKHEGEMDLCSVDNSHKNICGFVAAVRQYVTALNCFVTVPDCWFNSAILSPLCQLSSFSWHCFYRRILHSRSILYMVTLIRCHTELWHNFG